MVLMAEKIAVISDIHGNFWALQSVLDDLKKRNVDVIFNLGDSLYGPLDPAKTFELLCKQNMISILGNEDRLILDSVDKATTNSTLEYVMSKLSNEAFSWLDSLPPTTLYKDFFLCHGTVNRDDEYCIERVTEKGVKRKENDELLQDIRGIEQAVICCGHSHLNSVIQLKSNRYIVNPGSVGLQAYRDSVPFDHVMQTGNPNASYCIINKDNEWYRFEHVLVSYDWASAAACAVTNHRKDWARWLQTGKA